MRVQYISAIVIFLLSFTNTFGQTFDNCKPEGYLFIRVEEAPKFNGSLQEYFEKELKGKFQDFNGSIQLQILIDNSGKACCMSIRNNSSGISSMEIKDVINKMPDWTSAKQNNRHVSYAVAIQLTFKNSKLIVDYINEETTILKPAVNVNTINIPNIIKERRTKSVWKLWDINNSIIPSNFSRNIAMDNVGAIWYCTDNGIVKIFDDHWKVYDGRNVAALSGKNNSTWTTGLAVDKNNNIWIQSFNYIVKYDGKQWIKYDTTNSPLKLVQKICVDKNGIVWFCTFNGLIKYDGKNWTKFSIANSEIASDNVKEVYLTNDDALWIATDKGINKVINGNWTLFNTQNSNIQDNDITSIKGDSKGNIWAGIGTRDKNFLIKIDTTGKISAFASGVIWNITIDDNANKIWLATNGKGIVSFDGKEFNHYNKTNSILSSNTVSDILIDKNGDKWISTFGGLVFTNKK